MELQLDKTLDGSIKVKEEPLDSSEEISDLPAPQSKSMTKERSANEPLDDVPEDFFDDFENQDFLDGLDIVDAWDERARNIKLEKTDDDAPKTKQKEESRVSSSKTGEKPKAAPPKSGSNDKSKSIRKENEKKRNEEDKAKHKSSHSNEARRDPEKTKRDLAKDRQNYVKKQEQKLISKVIETGLVPPGMETEVNLKELEGKDSSDKQKKRSSTEISNEKKKEKSRERRSRPSSEKNRTIDKNKFQLERSRSRERWARKKSTEKHFTSSSKRRRSRSGSAKRHKPGEKLSFLEELQIKLSGHPSNNHSPMNYNNIMSHPQNYNMQPQINYAIDPYYQNQYDQNFFIGNQQPMAPMVNVQGPFYPQDMQYGMGQVPMGTYQDNFTPAPPPNSIVVQQENFNEGMASVSQLIEKIKASSAKSENAKDRSRDPFFINQSGNEASTSSSNSVELQKKISVLSRCQDILTELNGEKKFGGKLKVRQRLKKVEDPKPNRSPLLKTLPVNFSFTQSCVDKKKPSSFVTILNNALIKAGQEIIEIEDEEIVAPPPPRIREKKTRFAPLQKPQKPDVLMKMCQTDPVKCEDCEKRNEKKYVSVGIQCGETVRYNCGVQVNEADIIQSRIPKNQSLAHLTPAQLLGKTDASSARPVQQGNLLGTGNRPLQFPDNFQDFGNLQPEFIAQRRGYSNDGSYQRMEYQINQNQIQRDPRFHQQRY